VTLITMLIFILMTTIGYWCAKLLYPIGGEWLALAGAIGGFLGIPLCFAGHGMYRRWAYLGDKHMPDCSCGGTEFKVEKLEGDYYLLCQKCRRRYEKQNDRVMVYESGEKRLYKRLVKHQGWV
jgi:hypothetical protein